MGQALDYEAPIDFAIVQPTDFHGATIITEDGTEKPITEKNVQQALRELESVWMAHHNHYAKALDKLLERVYAARAIA